MRTIRTNAMLQVVFTAASALSLANMAFSAEADSKNIAATTAPAATETSEVAKLKALLAEQQVQLDRLRVALEDQKKMIEAIFKPKSLGEVASLSPMVPAGPSPNAIPALPAPEMQKTDTQKPSPLSLEIGNSYLTPVGFMDFTTINRSTVGGNNIGSNFGSIPYNNVANGHLSEMRLSAANSRVGFRFDSLYKGTNVLGYMEADFLGNNAGSLAITNNANTFRMRLYYVDLKKGQWELMAGQSWSMMTPGRKGISPIPGDIFFTQDIDVNYQAGLIWNRSPGIRVVYHPSKTLAFGFSAEAAEQYVGGGNGSTAITPPAALATTVFTEFNNSTTTFGVPNLHPDLIAKMTWDPAPISGHNLHFEIAGIERTFKSYNLATNQHYTKVAGGGSVNINFELFKNFRLLTNNYYSDGGGRYIFGLAPDTVIKANGDLGLIHSGSTVSGVEYTHGNTLVYGYYGGVYIGRYTVVDTTGGLVGYGFSKSGAGQNKSIQEGTIGFNQTVWKSAPYGAINVMGQYSYLSRAPWYVAVNTPKNAHQNMVYFNLRYTLPGSAPSLK